MALVFLLIRRVKSSSEIINLAAFLVELFLVDPFRQF